MATQPRRIRAADVPHIPISEPESTGYELVDGELVPAFSSACATIWMQESLSSGIIYPHARYAMVHRPDATARMKRESEALDGEEILPGFRLELGDLLRERL